MNQHTNIVRIKAVADALGSLNDSVVFVGGATVSLYPDRVLLNEVRPTNDVDIIVEVLNYKERLAIEEKLRNRGFTDDIESGIVCRFRVQGIVVDVMPTKDESIGFSNMWYAPGFQNSILHQIDSLCSIRILPAPYFVATKLEAFKGRGNKDGRTSHDFEDIIFVLENRMAIWQEFANGSPNLKKYLQSEFSEFLQIPHFKEWIDCHVERSTSPSTNSIYSDIEKFVNSPEL